MKKLIVFSLLLFWLLSCKKHPPENNKPGYIPAEEYSPLKVGNTWYYKMYSNNQGVKTFLRPETTYVKSFSGKDYHVVNIDNDSLIHWYADWHNATDAFKDFTGQDIFVTDYVNEKDTGISHTLLSKEDSLHIIKYNVYGGLRGIHTEAGDFDCIFVKYSYVKRFQDSTIYDYKYSWYGHGAGLIYEDETHVSEKGSQRDSSESLRILSGYSLK